jgi:hypothetical protein
LHQFKRFSRSGERMIGAENMANHGCRGLRQCLPRNAMVFKR